MITNFFSIIEAQRFFFNTNQTKEISFRKKQLKQLLQVLKANEVLMNEAIYKDFRKSAFENYATELSMIYHEINLAIHSIDAWAQRIRVGTDLPNMPAKSYIIPEPLGNTLVIGAWNYPYQLSILPAVSALAAGNTVIIKPSEIAWNTSNAMAKIINENFDERILHVIEGGVEETSALLKEKFDKIFYTGSSLVGKIVMKAASEHLCPVVLELGGKSPCIVLEDANLKIAAQRIVWAKFINSGQTCVAPDYILVDKKIKEKLIQALIQEINQQYGADPQQSEGLVRIINLKHFGRLESLIEQNKIAYGGKTDKSDLYIAPTLLHAVNFDDKVMQEEIFGPILPIIEFEQLDWAIQQIKQAPKPLALYTFTNNRRKLQKIQHEISFGGGAVNDAIMQLTNNNLPFGGVGNSGMGNYHGKYGFEAFTHYKSILEKSSLFEPRIKYTPYTKLKMRLLKILMG
jgi:aldehyde dehydrogenase (NAD+)